MARSLRGGRLGSLILSIVVFGSLYFMKTICEHKSPWVSHVSQLITQSVILSTVLQYLMNDHLILVVVLLLFSVVIKRIDYSSFINMLLYVILILIEILNTVIYY